MTLTCNVCIKKGRSSVQFVRRGLEKYIYVKRKSQVRTVICRFNFLRGEIYTIYMCVSVLTLL